jgi:hypothetical protein
MANTYQYYGKNSLGGDDGNEDFTRSTRSITEPLMTMGSAMGAMPLAGYASMVDPSLGEDVQQQLTYIPRSDEGMRGIESLMNSAPVKAMTNMSEWYGDQIDKYGEGHPILQTIAATLPTAVSLPRGAIRSGLMDAGTMINKGRTAIAGRGPLMLNIETSTARRADDAAETVRRFNKANAWAKHRRPELGDASMSDYPIGQGVWTGEAGAAQYHPNIMADMSHFEPQEIDDIRRSLKQMGIGAGRFVPDLIPQPSRANAMQVLDADPQWIKDIGAHYAAKDIPAVVFAQPNNRAMLFNMTTDQPGGLNALRGAPQLKGKKVRYGQSFEQLDRNYIDDVESAKVTGTPKKASKPPKKAK